MEESFIKFNFKGDDCNTEIKNIGSDKMLFAFTKLLDEAYEQNPQFAHYMIGAANGMIKALDEGKKVK